jgi:hypothetical protein
MTIKEYGKGIQKGDVVTSFLVHLKFFDPIAITSCKHTFHPFCLGELFRFNNKCCVCAQLLHPKWWQS